MSAHSIELTHLSIISSNRKTGPIPVSTSSLRTCPPSCGMWLACYAKLGPLHWHWNKVTRKERGESWSSFIKRITALPHNTCWRYGQAGDLPGKGNRINKHKLKQLVHANKGKKVLAYTHKPLTEANRRLIKEANDKGFTINLSADTLAEADKFIGLRIAPVIVILARDVDKVTYTPAGNKIVKCINDTNKRITCAKCQLCATRDRKYIIGFAPK